MNCSNKLMYRSAPQARVIQAASAGKRVTTHRMRLRVARVMAQASPTKVASNSLPKLRFNDGSDTEFPPLLNGCWTLAGGHGSQVFENIGETLAECASAGFTAFDTADIYGRSEAILGSFQKDWVSASNPPVQLFTKYVPNVFQSRPTKASVEASVRRSMKALQVNQLDLIQLHWWDYGIPGMVDVGLWLTELKDEGLIKSVGVTNMNTEAVRQLVEAGVPVVCNQVQFSLLDRRPLNGLLDYCISNNIKLFTYGSLAGGLLSDRYVEEPKKGLFGSKYTPIDLNTVSLKMYWNVVQRFGGQDLYRSLLTVLRQVADRHNCSVANVALSWVRAQGGGSMVVPIVGLRSARNIEENMAGLNVKLSKEDFDLIDSVLEKAQGPKGDAYSFERGN